MISCFIGIVLSSGSEAISNINTESTVVVANGAHKDHGTSAHATVPTLPSFSSNLYPVSFHLSPEPSDPLVQLHWTGILFASTCLQLQ